MSSGQTSVGPEITGGSTTNSKSISKQTSSEEPQSDAATIQMSPVNMEFQTTST